LLQSKVKGRRALFVAAGMKPVVEKIENLQYLSELIVRNRLKTIIDREYSMNDIAEAHRYVEAGHKQGNVVMKIC